MFYLDMRRTVHKHENTKNNTEKDTLKRLVGLTLFIYSKYTLNFLSEMNKQHTHKINIKIKSPISSAQMGTRKSK